MDYLLAIISGILLFLSYPPFDLSYLAFTSLIPLLISLERKSLFKGTILGFLFGLVFFGGLLFWINTMKLPEIREWVRPILWLALIGVLSLYPGLFGLLHRLVSKRFSRYTYLTAPILWCGLESLRNYFPFGGFPWGLLGYSQYLNLPLIQIASFTGVLGISFLIFLTNAIILEVISRHSTLKRKILLSTFYSLLSISCYAYGQWSLSKPLPPKNFRVAAVQGNFDVKVRWSWYPEERLCRRLEELTRRTIPFSPALVVWTETVISDPLGHLPVLAKRLGSLTKGAGSLLLVGSPHMDFRGGECRYYNSAFLLSPDGKIIDRYDKIHLVPFGERLPGERFIPGLRRLFPMVGDFTPGRELTLFRISNDTSFGVLICFEGIFGELVRRFVKEGADFMVNITNDSWSNSAASHYQHFQASIFRAIENRVYILRAGNTGVTSLVDPCGRIEEILPINTAGIITGRISTDREPSLYTRYGDLLGYFCLGTSLLFIPFSLRLKNSQV